MIYDLIDEILFIFLKEYYSREFIWEIYIDNLMLKGKCFRYERNGITKIVYFKDLLVLGG